MASEGDKDPTRSQVYCKNREIQENATINKSQRRKKAVDRGKGKLKAPTEPPSGTLGSSGGGMEIQDGIAASWILERQA